MKSIQLFVATLLVAATFSATIFAQQTNTLTGEPTELGKNFSAPDSRFTFDGLRGPAGLPGKNGQPGSQGPKGPQGQNGQDGQDANSTGIYQGVKSWNPASGSYVDARDKRNLEMAQAYTNGAVNNLQQRPQVVVNTTTPATSTGNAGEGYNSMWIFFGFCVAVFAIIAVITIILNHTARTATIAQQAAQTNLAGTVIANQASLVAADGRKILSTSSFFSGGGSYLQFQVDNTAPPAPPAAPVAPVAPVATINPQLIQLQPAPPPQAAPVPPPAMIINDPATALALVSQTVTLNTTP